MTVQGLVADNGLGGHEHFGHAAAPRAFVTDDDHVSRLNLFIDHGPVSVFFFVEYAGRPCEAALGEGNGGIFYDAAFRGDIPFEDGNAAFLGLFFHRKDDLVPGQLVIGEIAQSSFEEIVAPEIFQIFAEGPAGHGHNVQIQHILQKQLHIRNAACKPETFRQMLSTGVQVAEVWHLMIDLVKKFDGHFIGQLPGDAGQVQRGVGAAADGAVDDQCIAESGRRHDIGNFNVLFHQFHDFHTTVFSQ